VIPKEAAADESAGDANVPCCHHQHDQGKKAVVHPNSVLNKNTLSLVSCYYLRIIINWHQVHSMCFPRILCRSQGLPLS
jgi:hypothetical protein